ncbi:TlpA family protein disulfide reductase [Gammaproteobacteria bacterium]|nr:TlpA family protein disulfide reductase [Gammaproteobacteria bacterium]
MAGCLGNQRAGLAFGLARQNLQAKWFPCMPGIARLLVTLLLLVASPLTAAAPLLQNLQSNAFETIDQHMDPGKWLVVMIWASDCEICKREVGSYQQFHERHEQRDARVLGITLDGALGEKAARGFVAAHGVGFDNLIGEPETVTSYFQVVTGSPWVGTPTFLIYGPDGSLLAKQAGAVPVDLIEQFIAANSATQ